MSFFISILTSILFYINIYSFQLKTISGAPINLQQYSGKKILLVNTSTGSPLANQIASLEQLRQQMGDSLIIIAIPSNSFGTEPGTNASINSIMHSQYNANFIITEKIEVAGINQAAIYQWTTHVDQNGRFGHAVSGDFYKFLIDEEGYVAGVFVPLVDPLDQQILRAIRNN